MVVFAVLFVVLCVMAVVQFATRRGNRWAGVRSLSLAVMTVAFAFGQPPLDPLLPFAWRLYIGVGLAFSGFFVFLLSTVAPTFPRRQPQ